MLACEWVAKCGVINSQTATGWMIMDAERFVELCVCRDEHTIEFAVLRVELVNPGNANLCESAGGSDCLFN